MKKYKLTIDSSNTEYVIKTDESGKQYGIPFDPTNTDYQEYLKWLEEGNEPEPADTQGEQ